MVKAATDGRHPVKVSGPLAGLVHEFRLELIRRGFAPRMAQDHAYVLAHLSRWLGREGLTPAELDAERIAVFVAAGWGLSAVANDAVAGADDGLAAGTWGRAGRGAADGRSG